MSKKVVVIGGGASGFMAAITAAKSGASVTILEQNSKLGKKILSTGNGKCNLTNLDQKEEYYRSNTPEFPQSALGKFTVQDTISFFHEIGIYTKNKNGYLYPHSEQAASVVEVLEMEARRLKVKLKTNEKVTSIKQLCRNECDTVSETSKISGSNQETTAKNIKNDIISNVMDKFLVQTESWQYPCDSVILSCGSSASLIEGSDGSGYELAKSFGHSIVKPLPALIGLKGVGNQFNKWAGVRVEAEISLIIDAKTDNNEGNVNDDVNSNINKSINNNIDFNKRKISARGELQLTDYGISGIPVFQISRYASRAIDEGKRVTSIIDFLPSMTEEDCQNFLTSRMENRPNKTLKEQLVGIFPAKLIEVFFGNKKPSKMSIEELVRNIKRYEVKIKNTLDLDHAQVCTGGISCQEVNPETMESKLVPSVYFCGEILDVDGTCGGYNLQWAWSSGYVAGSSAGQKNIL